MRWTRGWAAALVLCAASVGHAAPNDWAEGRDEADDGATRDFYNRGARLAWRNMGGDWVDRDGTAQGTAAWASTVVEDTDAERYVVWDVTELVAAWLDGTLPHQGLLLHTESGGPIDFSSREAAANPPELVVDGVTLTATADTYTEPSTFQSQGENERLRVGDGQNLLVRFDLSSLSGPITSATLRVHTTRQFGGGADIGVFLPAPGRQGPPPGFEEGLAAGFDMDGAIADHPDVVFFADFESDGWMDGWSDLGGSFDVADGGSEHGFEALEGRALRVLLPEGENTALDLSYRFMEETGSEPDEIFLRYYLRLGSDWNQSVDGGKLPGIAGTYGRGGWGGRRSDGSNGWSARGLFRESVIDANPLAGATPVGSYVYHADQETTYGDNFIWVDGWGEEGFGGILHTERWYALETYVRMNTPGERDGVIRAWVDGRLSFEKTDVRFRDVDTLHIERIWMNIYHGGTDVSPYDQHAFIDNVVVATSYIGPMRGAPTPPPPTPSGDGGPSPSDGGTPATVDAAPPGPGATGDDGCGCRVTRPGSVPWTLGLALFVAHALARRRRRG